MPAKNTKNDQDKQQIARDMVDDAIDKILKEGGLENTYMYSTPISIWAPFLTQFTSLFAEAYEAIDDEAHTTIKDDPERMIKMLIYEALSCLVRLDLSLVSWRARQIILQQMAESPTESKLVN